MTTPTPHQRSMIWFDYHEAHRLLEAVRWAIDSFDRDVDRYVSWRDLAFGVANDEQEATEADLNRHERYRDWRFLRRKLARAVETLDPLDEPLTHQNLRRLVREVSCSMRDPHAEDLP